MKKLIISLFCLAVTLSSYSATVDTVSIFSNAMNRSYKCVVIKPDIEQDKPMPLPVVYLLHGYSGWYANWLLRVPALKEQADQFRMMIVCPDGGYGSWYINSPADSNIKFETYVAEEIPAWIDAHYFTIKDRKGRAITGLSMGGHGGLYLGFRHANTFGACGSMSGGVDLQPFVKNWDLSSLLGDPSNHSDNWKNFSVITVVENKPAAPLAVMIDCGVDDFFYEVNKALHQKMLALKIPHDYIERPGKHDWAYWQNAVKYQLLFFRDYFDKK